VSYGLNLSLFYFFAKKRHDYSFLLSFPLSPHDVPFQREMRAFLSFHPSSLFAYIVNNATPPLFFSLLWSPPPFERRGRGQPCLFSSPGAEGISRINLGPTSFPLLLRTVHTDFSRQNKDGRTSSFLSERAFPPPFFSSSSL